MHVVVVILGMILLLAIAAFVLFMAIQLLMVATPVVKFAGSVLVAPALIVVRRMGRHPRRFERLCEWLHSD